MIYADPMAAAHIVTIPGADTLDGWVDVSEPALVGVRTMQHTASGVVAIAVRRESLWDVVAVRGREVRQTVLLDSEVVDWLTAIAS